MTSNEKLIQELSELDKKHFLHPTSSIKQQQAEGPAKIFEKGEGIYLYDLKGDKFIDGLSGLWNVNIGHGREEIGEVAKEQISKLAFTSAFATYSHEPAIRLAAKIAEITPGDLNTIFFTSGGSEANDTAFKLVRNYWKLNDQPAKKKIVSRKMSYHGVAMGATSATALQPFRDFTTSLAPDFYSVESTPESFQAFIDHEGADTIAAYISEPVQGTGGVIPAPEGYFKAIRKICDENDILFIADEVITGFGRTGKWFGMDYYGVTPDIMCVAKGISSGYAQLGGVILSDKIMETLKEKTEGNMMHGYTYSGHPVATAIGLKNIEIIERENLIQNAEDMGNYLMEGFESLQKKHAIVGEVRHVGLMAAIEIVKDQETNEKFEEPISPRILGLTTDRGLLCRAVLYEGSDTLIFAPPLTISKEEVDEIIQILDESLSEIMALA